LRTTLSFFLNILQQDKCRRLCCLVSGDL